jgi:hypothetical protein
MIENDMTLTQKSQENRPRLIQIQRYSGNGKDVASRDVETQPVTDEDLREEVAQGFLYAHSRANANSSKLLEVASFSYALIELLSERGLITIEELDRRKEEVNKRLVEKFAEKGMGVALTAEENGASGELLNVEIDCEKRLHLCQAACCRLRFALTVPDVEKGAVKWNLGQPYMIRQGADGYCFHFDRASQHCGIYEDRPFVCRAYDCRKDQRIWQDFENRIVSPELGNLINRLKTGGGNGESRESDGAIE